MSEEGKYTAVEMDEKRSNQGNSDLEQPFDENFWLEVSKLMNKMNFMKIKHA